MSLLSLLAPVLRTYVRHLSKKSLPNYNESHRLSGLKQKVDIKRDRWAVPHIQARSEEDLFFAQGFLHAQDRLWQMEMNRRIASGRLSELFGSIALDADRISRSLGFRRLAQGDWKRYEGKAIASVGTAYSAGVNAFIEKSKHLPPEFKLLGIKPEPWTEIDSLAYGRFISFAMSYGWAHEIERMRLAAEVGVEKAAELHPEYPFFNPAVLPKGIETYRVVDGRYEAFQGPFLKAMGGSNNWSVAAHLMKNGSAVLCNDPHLSLNMPNIWYENHLNCPDYEATGVSLLGVPMVLIGHNRNIAWGATLSFVDMQDTYIETFSDSDCKKYQFKGQLLDSRIVEEEIRIKGQKKNHIEQVIYTHHGPIISDIVGEKEKKISLQSKCLEEDIEMMQGFYQLNKAKNWNEFVAATALIQAPSLNLAYADTDNNIGYYVTGAVPLRRKDEDLFPRSGSSGEYEWEGRVPFEEMPHAFNPIAGYVFSCNNKVVEDNYPHDLGNVWMNGYRANRLGQLFGGQRTYSLEDFEKWQMDLHCIPGLQFVELFKKYLLQADGSSIAAMPSTLKPLLRRFLAWDGQLDKNTVGGCIYQVLKQSLLDVIFADNLGNEGLQRLKGKGLNPPLLRDNEFWGHDTVLLLRMLQEPEKTLWLKEDPSKIIIRAMEKTLAYLEKTLGRNMEDWQWGKLHQMRLLHVLGAKKPLDSIFNIEGIAMGGDSDTLCQVNFEPGNPYGGTLVAASYRQIIDMGDFSQARSISPVGQSGNLLSPHRNDQLEMWLRGEYKPMVWTKEQIEEYGHYYTVLEPW